MTSRRAWVMGTLTVLAAAIVALVLLFDWNWVKAPLESQISSRLGRPFQIAGSLDVDLGLQARITIHDARLANPPWAGEQPMLEVRQAEFVIDLPALLHGRIDLPEVRITKASLRLETRPNGPPSWRFPSPSTGLWIPEIGQLWISDASVRYLARGSGRRLVAHLDQVTGSTGQPDDNRGLVLSGSGKVQGQPLHLKLSGPPAAELGQESKPVALDLQLGKSDVAGDLTLDLDRAMPSIIARLHSNQVDTTELAGLMSEAKAVRPAPANDASSAAPAALSRIESALNGLDLSRLPNVDAKLDYRIKDLEAPDLTLHDVHLEIGLHDQVPRLALEGTGTYKGQPLTLDFTAAPAQTGKPQQAYAVDAKIEAGRSRITASSGAIRAARTVREPLIEVVRRAALL